MNIHFRSVSIASCLLLLASCAATAPDPHAQSVIESLAGKHENVVRLTLHAVPMGKQDYCAVASTSDKKLGTPSDPEDLKAMKTGEVIVLDEPGGIDVTVPIGMKDGKHTAVAGVTLKAAMGRDAAILAAKTIAAELDSSLSTAAMKK